MSFVATFVGAALVPQLQLQPVPAVVGEVVTVSALAADVPLADVEVVVKLPDGRRLACGRTAKDGRLQFVPSQAGPHGFAATIQGVRSMAPLVVRAARRRWWLAFATVPLAAALGWGALGRGPLGRGPLGRGASRGGLSRARGPRGS